MSQKDKTELEKRMEIYLCSEDFQLDMNDLASDYRSQGLPVPPEDQLRQEAVAEAEKCMKTILLCERKGHLWKERADPENGTSTLTCRRCGKTENLRW